MKIDRSKLDASNLLWKVPEPQRKENHILYRLTSLPRHGALSIKGHNLTRCKIKNVITAIQTLHISEVKKRMYCL